MKPMLAGTADPDLLAGEWRVSPKLDGIRCLIINGVPCTRSLKPIPNRHVQSLLGGFKFNYLDGELIVGEPAGPGVYQRTMSGIMAQDGRPDFKFYVFDDFTIPNYKFNHRLGLAHATVRRHDVPWVKELLHISVADQNDLLAYEQEQLIKGYEGVMLRDPSGPYKYGRSTLKEGWLLKLKRFEDSEAEIIGVTQLMHNANEATVNELGYKERSSKKDGKVGKPLLGALMVRDVKTRVEFEIGTGFNAHDREVMWSGRKHLTGRLVKYKFQPVGVKDKPRFPVFIGFRDALDMSST